MELPNLLTHKPQLLRRYLLFPLLCKTLFFLHFGHVKNDVSLRRMYFFW